MLTSLIVLLVLLAVACATLPMDERIKKLVYFAAVVLFCLVLYVVFRNYIYVGNLP